MTPATAFKAKARSVIPPDKNTVVSGNLVINLPFLRRLLPDLRSSGDGTTPPGESVSGSVVVFPSPG
jgi:hypothetical protein